MDDSKHPPRRFSSSVDAASVAEVESHVGTGIRNPH